MFKLRSISARLVLTISLTVAAACATLAAFSVVQQQSLTKLALDQELKVQYESVIAAFDYEGRTAMALSAAIAAMPQVADEVAKGDRDGVMKLLGETTAALKAQGIRFVNLIAPPATIFLRLHEPKTFGDDISGRRKTVVTANDKGVPVVGVERGRATLAVFAMTPVMRDGKSRFVVDVGTELGKEFADRIKQRLGVDIAIHAFDGKSFETLAATFAERTTASPEDLKSVLAGATLRNDAEIGGHPAAVYLGQIKNFAGEPVAVLELVKDTSLYEASKWTARRNLILGTVAILLLGGLLALFLGRGLSRPITRTMNRLSGGETAIAIPGRDRSDELGTMATAVEVFRQSMIDADRLRVEQAETERNAEAQSKANMRRLADEFENAVGEIVRAVSSASSELEASASTLNLTAENTRHLTGTVASASQAASANVQSVASASEELAASVTEIGRQVEQSTRIAGEAVRQAENTDARISDLSKAAERIGDVINLITSIAEQTNLLALNATIEAARAGDAGRGFAVVASEVKALAGQTAKATNEISTQIAGMQSATQDSVSAIKGIGGTIGRISEIAATIASAVEEQGAATQEISRNIQQASQGTSQVASNIVEVNRGAAESGSASTQMLSSARMLAGESNLLTLEMDKFLSTVRAA
ncbi:MAG: methyl-accepting chemotaxis protein [Bradyrhizobium sp.]|jgi:methyl-accepting chemotaxis protein|nr:methyl-accepting chemotaxis protein [Bradyrhizobium sp.]